MTESIDPLRPISDERRQAARRRRDPAPDLSRPGEETHLLPVVAGAPSEPPKPVAPPGPAVFAAQLMGQEGQRRGLRGGPPVLEEARNAYLGAEWSGGADRRPPRGAASKTEV